MNLMEWHGILCDWGGLSILGILAAVVVVGYFGSPLWIWALLSLAALFGFGASTLVLAVVAAGFAVFVISPIRRLIISPILMKVMAPIMPKISETERTALEAGVVWMEAELFSGKPDFRKMMAQPYPDLTAEEKKFMDGPCRQLCEMADQWKIWKTREFEKDIWDFMKRERFFGMIIPKEYGGLGFSALAHSQVVMMLASRSVPACVTVMVPNSLGPAELLIHYGTDEQKKHYLPRLARGEEIPCFGLTEPLAGSDASSITSSAEVFKGDDGKLYMKLNWNKRWITLAAVSTVVGLAFRLRDPKNYLGKGEDIGITCGLIPANTKGVVLGKRHDPLTIPFYNCPTQGQDVILPLDAIIGGPEQAGKGWQMLMDCLAAGRGISLPAQATGGAKLATLVCSAHGMIRQQFGVSIGKFEGVEEPLARIAGLTYGMEAARKYTVGALDQGVKPPVVTAILKHYMTELGRKLINDGMDIMGGAGISLGPRNTLAEIYVATPISITVEGANILTRTLIIFGQGALRAHPYAYKEVISIEKKDLAGFDEAFFGHIGHVTRNLFRSLVLSWTRGYVTTTSDVPKELRMYARRLKWASASFAILADISMATLGGTLKFREKITGRFADIMGHMYLAAATIRRFKAEGEKAEDLAFAKYTLKYCLVEIQKAFDGIFDNMFGVKQKSLVGKIVFGLGHWVFKEVIGGWSRINSIGSQSSDHLGHVICDAVLSGAEVRQRLVEGIFIPKDQKFHIGKLENAFRLVLQSEAIERKVHRARREGTLPRLKGAALMEAAREKNVISAAEYTTMKEALAARVDAVQVDDFTEEAYKRPSV